MNIDTSRQSESEYEQELDVKPEPIERRTDMSDSDSVSSNGLKLTLNQCEMASNSSSAMTPRILKEQERKDHLEKMIMNPEIDFSSRVTMKPAKLSPDRYEWIRELTSQRRKEQLELSSECTDPYAPKVSDYDCCINVETPLKMGNYQTHDVDSPAYFENEKMYRQQEIIERLENLL